MVTFFVFVRLTDRKQNQVAMTQTILNGVSKKVRDNYHKGNITEQMLIKQYERNCKEAVEFSFFGYGINELMEAKRDTHNPLLQSKLQLAIQEFRDRQAKSGMQNKISLEKLQAFKESALGMGLRKVIAKLRHHCKINNNSEAQLLLLLLELEFANLSAKSANYGKGVKSKIYARKDILIHKIQPLLKKCGWKYGYNDAAGKNASYIIYVYMPNDVQLSWHSNNYYLYKYFPPIDAEWDGQICMTMEKILNYINGKNVLK